MARYTYALIDGVMRQTAIRDLYSKKEPLQTIPLYINTPYKENYDLGPILVSALDGSSLINEIKQSWTNSTTIIHSNEYLQTIADHLKQLITVTDETNSKALFRFADPLITWYWLNSYKQNALPDIMGPINTWRVPVPIAKWQQSTIEWQTFENPQTEPLGIKLDYLNEPQVEALNQAAAFKLKNEIYETCIEIMPNFFENQPESKISQWMDLQHKKATEFGVISNRSYAMWYVMAMEFGNDFATKPQGIYQSWLTSQPKYKGLPAEVNIQHFFDERIQPSEAVAMEIA